MEKIFAAFEELYKAVWEFLYNTILADLKK